MWERGRPVLRKQVIANDQLYYGKTNVLHGRYADYLVLQNIFSKAKFSRKLYLTLAKYAFSEEQNGSKVFFEKRLVRDRRRCSNRDPDDAFLAQKLWFQSIKCHCLCPHWTRNHPYLRSWRIHVLWKQFRNWFSQGMIEQNVSQNWLRKMFSLPLNWTGVDATQSDQMETVILYWKFALQERQGEREISKDLD